MSRPFIREALLRSRAFISVAILLVLTFGASLTVVSAPLTNVFVNGVRVDAYPVIHDGIAYLPIQVMAQAMEAEIIWDAKLGVVKVNGVNSPASVYNQNGKVLLPIESFITGLGGNVIYDGRNNMIRLETPEFMANGPSHAKSQQTAGKTAPNAAVPNTAASSAQPANPSPSYTAPAAAAGTTAALSARAANPGSAFGVPPSAAKSAAANTGSELGAYNKTGGTYAYGTPKTAVQTPASPAGYGGGPSAAGTGAKVYAQTETAANTPGTFSTNSAAVTGTAPGVGISSSSKNRSVYVPRTAQNNVFKVTVSNLEIVPVIKDFYKPHAGSKFVVASLSQQNISNQVQIYTGKFSLVDQNQNSYEHLEGLSNFWLVILRPYGINFGYLVFEIPENAKPVSLVLHALTQSPLTINL